MLTGVVVGWYLGYGLSDRFHIADAHPLEELLEHEFGELQGLLGEAVDLQVLEKLEVCGSRQKTVCD